MTSGFGNSTFQFEAHRTSEVVGLLDSPPSASWLRHLGQCGEKLDEFDLLVKVRIRCLEHVIQPTRCYVKDPHTYVTHPPKKKNMPTFLNFLIIWVHY